jgi:hypothetical protein
MRGVVREGVTVGDVVKECIVQGFQEVTRSIQRDAWWGVYLI